jgi:hypothetical protein
MVDGKLADNGKRALLETSEYDLKGAKILNQYFPSERNPRQPGARPTSYDDKGNISEMTLMGTDGSLISKETYNYDYDSLGNWVKMTSSVAVVENGRISFEPSEVTYRTIFYYLDASMTRMLEGPGHCFCRPEAAERRIRFRDKEFEHGTFHPFGPGVFNHPYAANKIYKIRMGPRSCLTGTCSLYRTRKFR